MTVVVTEDDDDAVALPEKPPETVAVVDNVI